MDDPTGGSAVLHTRRLVLEPMSCALMRAVLDRDWDGAGELLGADFPPEWRADGWAWLAPRLADGERDPALLGWGTRLARPAGEEGAVLAEVGFHGPPDAEGWAEIGYRTVAAHRRQGIAEEAVSALLGWAAARGVVGVRASVDPDNAASAALLAKLGFAAAGAYRHEVLGEQVLFRRGARA